MGYFQTWNKVTKIRRWPFIGPAIVRSIQAICGIIGHERSLTEWGYGGGEYADVWCRWCNHHWRIPYIELMEDLGPETKTVIRNAFFH